MSTRISWCDETANPFYALGVEAANLFHAFGIVTERGWHCEKVSLGCQHCYSEAQNVSRLFNMGTGLPFVPASREKVTFHLDEKVLDLWMRARVGKRIFVNSMTDTFGDWWPDEFRDKMFHAMAQSQHTFLLLTKRASEAKKYLHAVPGDSAPIRPLPNVWLGVSVETPSYLWRVEELLETPAAHRFVSYEPVLRYVDFRPYLGPGKVEWLLFGAETGSEARACIGDPMLDIAGDVICQCRETGSAPFIKHLGPIWRSKCGATSPHGSDMSEWPEELRVQEFPEVAE